MLSRVELFERIRRDRRVEPGVSVRELARRHGVHRRTVREALASAVPAERKKPARPRSLVLEPVMGWIRDSAIGTLREVHNWTNRPVWPQYPTMPSDTPPVPEGFDWDLWLGPEAERPYHPSYTHMVFRAGTTSAAGQWRIWGTTVCGLSSTRWSCRDRCR